MAVRCVSVDWLKMYCESSMIVQNKRWEWRKVEHGTQQFRDVYKVYDRERQEQYCYVEMTPYSPIIPKRTVMVQVCNRWLYKKNWNVELNNFLLASNIIPISISRIDIACDFNTFAKGLKPESVIKRMASGEYCVKSGRKIDFQGVTGHGITYEYMRLGNRDSEISAYLYNKTKELKQVMDKPYIREMWSNSGLDVQADVWRLEVSLSNVQMRTIVKETGEVFRLDLDFLQSQAVVENVYNCAIMKAFELHKYEEGKRISRMKKVLLFDQMSSTLLMAVPTEEPKTNRMDRIIVKRLACSHQMYRISNPEKARKMEMTLDVLLENSALYDYYYERVVPFIGWYKDR